MEIKKKNFELKRFSSCSSCIIFGKISTFFDNYPYIFCIAYTIDNIFNVTFGMDSETLRYPNSEIHYYGEMAVEGSMLRNLMAFLAPKILYALRQPFTPPPVIKFFIKLFHDMVTKRIQNGIKRNDVLDSLIELMDKEEMNGKKVESNNNEIQAGKIPERLEFVVVAAQAYVFFLAGFETSASTITHSIYELALNPKIQEKLRGEIDEFHRSNKTLNYDNIMKLEYLDMVLQETMRKHAPLPFLSRVCIDDYKIPNSDYTIPSGMGLIIPVSGLQMDSDIFPEPQKFDPTRFNKKNIASMHPCSYLPFGDGPRICIGKRLGILQFKMILFQLLSNYTFSVCEKTPISSVYSTSSITQRPRDDIYLKVERREMAKN